VLRCGAEARSFRCRVMEMILILVYDYYESRVAMVDDGLVFCGQQGEITYHYTLHIIIIITM